MRVRDTELILLWGLARDGPLSAVRSELSRCQAPVLFVDRPETGHVSLELRLSEAPTGRLRIGSRDLLLEDVSSIYIRGYELIPTSASASSDSSALEYIAHFNQMLWLWANHTRALVVNRPHAMASNNSKPFQASLIRRAGFEVPETLITSDPASAREFCERHPGAVYKSISSRRSIVARVDQALPERLRDVQWCPTQFQEYVTGLEHRVHVIGDLIFTCDIRSDAVDYRYAGLQGMSVELRPAVLPLECVERCRRLVAEMGLVVAGLDLRRTPEGAWYCFEVNPCPDFTFFDRHPEGAIARAVAALLARNVTEVGADKGSLILECAGSDRSRDSVLSGR